MPISPKNISFSTEKKPLTQTARLVQMAKDLISFNLQHQHHLRSGFAFIYIALFLNSCTPEMFRGLKSAGGDYSKEMTVLFGPDQKESLVYKTSIKYKYKDKDKEFSSLTYLNEISDSVFKIVLLTNFGNTLLEAEISKEKFTVNNVISYLDRKPILKLLENDWRLLLRGNFSCGIPLLFSVNSENKVFDFADGRTHNLYHYNPEDKSVKLIELYHGKSRKVIITVDSVQDQVPGAFTIEHPSLDLKITMSLLKKISNEPVE